MTTGTKTTVHRQQWPGGKTATMNVTYKQGNAAGGAVVCEISPGGGNEFIVFAARAINSGTNTVVMRSGSAVGGTPIQTYTNIGSGAGTSGMLGGTSSGSPASINIPPPGLVVSGTQTFRIEQTGPGLQNDTFQALVNIRVYGSVTTGFIVTHANSTNPADVSVTAGSETFTVI